MADGFPKFKRPSVILVTGLPFTGCVQLSLHIAAWAKCPWLGHEVVLGSLGEAACYGVFTDNPPLEEEAARFLRDSFHITCSTALSQLSVCAPTDCVVISSYNLSFKSQLLGLLNVMIQRGGGRLLIVECLRKNKFWWQQSADKLIDVRAWYNPKGWKDVEKAILHRQQVGVDACFLTLLHPTPPGLVDAVKIVLDPNEDLNTHDVSFTSKVQLDMKSFFIQAIMDLLTCDDVNNYGDGSHVVDYPLWRRQRLEELGRSFASRVTTEHHWCARHGDCIFRLTQQPEEEEEATCEICDGKIPSKERAYYCQFCSLSFHEACCSASPTSITAEELSRVLDSIKYSYDRVFPETHACYSCIREHKGFSGTCASCIYRTTLKSKLLSPIVRHSCDQTHILTTSLTHESRFLFPCKACGRFVVSNAYYCNICSSTYHMECLHLPLQMEHHHGRHLHRMKIDFSCTKEEEYEWCLACWKDIDPNTWVYTCLECDYVAHLYCVFSFLSTRLHSIYDEDCRDHSLKVNPNFT